MATVTKPIALDESFHTTETPSRNIADVLASLGDAISQGAQPVTKKLATNVFKTINGGLVDGLTVQFTPVQDLHGQSKPWAGGAGKNKAKSFVNGTTRSQYDNALWIDSDNLLPDTTYIISGKCGETVNRYYTNENVFTENEYFYSNTGEFSVTVTTVSSLNKSTASQYTADKGWRVFKNAQAQSADPDFDEVMIRLASIADPTFEPYANICPISGHTQVQSKINNTTYTTSLGGTEYGGEVDMVSGEGKVTRGLATSFSRGSLDSSGKLYNVAYISGIKPVLTTMTPDLICNYFESLELGDARTSGAKCITQYNTALYIGGYVGDEATLDALLSTMEVSYPLDTPTTLTLTGQNITAEVGVNNVSAPLDGQSIKTDSVIYKDMFTWEDVLKVI